MQDSDKLTELIEQAACTINMLTATDVSEIKELQAVLNQINGAMEQLVDVPATTLDAARGAGSDAATLVQKILENEVEDTAQAIEIISQAISAIQGLAGQFGRGGVCGPEAVDSSFDLSDESKDTVICEDDVPLIIDFIAEAAEHIESAETGLLELEAKPGDADVLNQIFRGFHTIKGMAGFLNLDEIGSVAHSAENLLDMARKEELILAGANTDLVFESIDMLKNLMGRLRSSVENGRPVSREQGVSALLDKLKDAAEGKLPAETTEPVMQRVTDKKIDAVLEEAEQTPVKVSTGENKKTGEAKIKVSTERLDNLINMAGELVIAQSMVSEEVATNLNLDQQLGRKVVHMSKIVRELQELSMSMRMVPIQGVFQKMARLVRDLSRKSGKNVAFSTSGEETELDRSIVDKIADPLVHMVRNSVDHGIESADERTKAGKSASGTVELDAYHQAGSIIIEIRDDGRGLNRDAILRKAVDNGVVESGQDLTDEDVFKLIFHPGLSTAQKITSVSGRGVGMDVVKKNIEALQGKIDISSIPGEGTTFTIRLPLTLAIIDGQIVKVGSERYIVPINSILRSFRPSASQVSTVHNAGEMAMVRGELVPLVRLYELFKTPPETEDPTESLLVIVEEDDRKCCLLVDELLGQQQVVIKSLGSGLGRVQGISGGAIMGDGKVSLILDVPGIIELSQN